MSALALALVLASAAIHATWNLLVKRLGGTVGGAALTWLLGAVSGALLTPVALWQVAAEPGMLAGTRPLWLLGGAALHVAYFLLLLRGYRVGDLSVVYPIARGSGPLVALAVAVTALGEPATPPAIGGALLVALGVVILAGGVRAARVPPTRSPAAVGGAREGADGELRARTRRGVAYGLGIGAMIGSYTLWDRHLVGPLAVAPIVVEWSSATLMAALVTPLVRRDRAALGRAWAAHRGAVVLVALLSSGSYILFLTALGMDAVSRVAPARETSILFGALLGARGLGEGHIGERLAGAAAMTAGVALLALG